MADRPLLRVPWSLKRNFLLKRKCKDLVRFCLQNDNISSADFSLEISYTDRISTSIQKEFLLLSFEIPRELTRVDQ